MKERRTHIPFSRATWCAPRLIRAVITGAVCRVPLVICTILMVWIPSAGQEVTVTARVDSNNILIGDFLNLHLEVHHPSDRNVAFAGVPDSLAGFEILRRDSVVKTMTDRGVVETTTWTITSYDSGTFVVPPLRVLYSNPGDTTIHFAESVPIPIFVHSLDVDTSQAIKDIKPPISLGISFAELLPYIAGVVAAAAIGWLIMYYVKKRRRGETFIPEPPPRPAHELALDALRSLESENYWQRGKVKEFHSKLTDIVRLYIERKFNVMALEMITEDILDAAPIKGLNGEATDHLRRMLTLADLVKFAKLQPLPDENEKSMKAAYQFVESTVHAGEPQPREGVPAEASV